MEEEDTVSPSQDWKDAIKNEIKQLRADIMATKKSVPKGDKKANTEKSKKENKEKEVKAKSLKPDWMMVKPKEGEPKKKTVDGKEYHWCPNHEAWTRHSPEECKGKGAGASNKPPKGKKGKPKPKLSMSRALQAIAEDDGEESE